MDNVGQSGPVAEMAQSDEAPIIIVTHQIGSGANGGLQSLSEIIAATPRIKKLVVTNRDGDFAARWREHAEVLIWPTGERTYSGRPAHAFKRLRRVFARIANSFRMAALVRRRGVRVVHCNDRIAFWHSAFGAKLGGARLILNVRDTLRDGADSGLSWRIALWLCDCFLVLSKEMQQAWETALAPFSRRPRQAEKFQYIYSIVDFDKFHEISEPARRELRDSLGIPADRFAIGYIGRIEEKKDQLGFLREALPLIRTGIDNALVTFVGDFNAKLDPYAAACLAEVERQGAGASVRFVGYSAEVVDWYQAVDALVLASRREGLPRCMIEGLACGAPFVSFDVCSVREVLDGHACGISVPRGDYGALASALTRLYKDGEATRDLRQKGPKVALQLFSGSESVRRYTSLVRHLSENRGPVSGAAMGIAE